MQATLYTFIAYTANTELLNVEWKERPALILTTQRQGTAHATEYTISHANLYLILLNPTTSELENDYECRNPIGVIKGVMWPDAVFCLFLYLSEP